MKIKLPREVMLEKLDDPIERKLVDHTRWSLIYNIVFEHEGKFYQASYTQGATEQQDESPWEYDKEVECVEVEKKQKLIDVWEPVA